jgi:hypothetical protein
MRFGCAGVGEGEAEVEGAAAAFVRVLRCCLLVDCFFLASALAVVAVRGEGGSEPMVAMVDVRLSDESLALLDVDANDSILAMV